jgi:uncharacterized MAPEG superfamily protein
MRAMSTPFWCLLVGTLLPYVWSVVALLERIQQFGRPDNKLPRAEQQKLEGRGARAVGAHKNAFEALAIFAPAVIVAHLAGADALWSMRLALAWVVLRVFHGLAYLLDADRLRSLSFVLALGACVGLFVLAAQG